ncbi:nicotinamide riboside transporter PnuC [uncultured Mesonia sp.]|uniref:nicotinamide riboside transporter PnuC n=1 Tax=uncultured Mesonia sp. TaxID=399731 RepID=UPI00374EA1DD
MNWLEWFFEPYIGVSWHLILLEFVAVVFGFLSVWYSKENHIWVYPTGIINTSIFVYILWYYGLLGDMLINGYYFSMSIYGWYIWSRKKNGETLHRIEHASFKEHLYGLLLFVGTAIFVIGVYTVFEKWDGWISYMDVFTTAIFFVGMWLMAKRKIENWIFWIIGDLVSIPLYFYKGLNMAAVQYILFTIIAIYGYYSWIKIYNNNQVIVSK